MYTQPDDKINDKLVVKLNKLNKTNDNEELSLTPVLLLHSQFGHAARARVLSAFLLHTYMSQDIFPTLAMIPAPPLASHPTLLCEVGPQHLVLLFDDDDDLLSPTLTVTYHGKRVYADIPSRG